MDSIDVQPTAASRSAEPDVLAEISPMVALIRRAFESERTRSYAWRRQQLEAFRRFVQEREHEIAEALAADLGKPGLEAYTTEIAYVLSETELTLKNLKKWMKPQRVPTAAFAQPGVSRRVPEPYGVVLIIAPWNYPFSLVTTPLLGAIAAGNCAVVKPSEVSPHTSALLARYLPEYLDPDCVKVVEGGVAETTALLEQRFDYIFYTGNGKVGRIVMRAAAEHLTPVTLELGGKSPCIVDRDADLKTTAKRILWGKYSNAGQTCVAPDYVLVHRDVHDALLETLSSTIRDFYGDDPQRSDDYGRVINARHHRRLMSLLDSGEIVTGGQADEGDCYIAPTVLKNVHPDSPIMQEEIFGPILPVLEVRDIEEAVRFINQRDKPLAVYLFSRSAQSHDRIVSSTSSGGVSINHTWIHLAVPDLPFGGVGESGMGAYHGRRTFDTFSHEKSVLKKPFAIDPPITYPPYTNWKRKMIRKLL